MGLLDKLKQRRGRGKRKDKPAEKGRRRQDPDYAGLPGGSSSKEAAEAPPERAGELAD